MEEFDFEGFKATLVFPEKANEKKYWTIKTEYRDAFPETEIELLRRGWHVAYLTNENRWATPSDCHRKARFAKHLHESYGLYEKCVPVGMSCGGCHAVNFAGFHPESVACMFIDAPVLNFMDNPARITETHPESVWENEFKKAYPGITRHGLLNFDNHPINKAPILIEHKIPILLVYGTQDLSVEYEYHGKMMEDIYTDHPGLLTIMIRHTQGHHPHGFPQNPEKIADWIEANM